ncbi:hypothetical protein BLNAU_13068 [Blattamonas nauphoetae]|uniref:Uncharacterized protein n=1 Tax=Blattamonas nauphoetae TaxID=2049346 RepID=A0ABQ9XHQ1_9EUKA|nr:hypothetical protein BLNAU_13068 [Blattamonas nauphoetae]
MLFSNSPLSDLRHSPLKHSIEEPTHKLDRHRSNVIPTSPPTRPAARHFPHPQPLLATDTTTPSESAATPDLRNILTPRAKADTSTTSSSPSSNSVTLETLLSHFFSIQTRNTTCLNDNQAVTPRHLKSSPSPRFFVAISNSLTRSLPTHTSVTPRTTHTSISPHSKDSSSVTVSFLSSSLSLRSSPAQEMWQQCGRSVFSVRKWRQCLERGKGYRVENITGVANNHFSSRFLFDLGAVVCQLEDTTVDEGVIIHPEPDRSNVSPASHNSAKGSATITQRRAWIDLVVTSSFESTLSTTLHATVALPSRTNSSTLCRPGSERSCCAALWSMRP